MKVLIIQFHAEASSTHLVYDVNTAKCRDCQNVHGIEVIKISEEPLQVDVAKLKMPQFRWLKRFGQNIFDDCVHHEQLMRSHYQNDERHQCENN